MDKSYIKDNLNRNDGSIVLLDGGVGGSITKAIPEQKRYCWSTLSYSEEGAEVTKNVHSDFFKAGAQIASANTYNAVSSRIEKDVTQVDARELCVKVLELAKQARDKNGSGLVGGSLGPLFNSYRPDQDNSKTFDQQVTLYIEYISNLIDSDILMFETISSFFHASVILEAIRRKRPEQPILFSITVDDYDGTKLRSGEPVKDLFDNLLVKPRDIDLIDAITVNCSRPEAISECIEELKKFNKPFGGYGNGFKNVNSYVATTKYEDVTTRDDLSVKTYCDFVMDWINKGATIVGGCCEITPKYIEQVAKSIKSNGYHIKTFPTENSKSIQSNGYHIKHSLQKSTLHSVLI